MSADVPDVYEILGIDGRVDPANVICDDDNHNGIEVYLAIGGIVVRSVTTGEPPNRWAPTSERICLDPNELWSRIEDLHAQWEDDEA